MHTDTAVHSDGKTLVEDRYFSREQLAHELDTTTRTLDRMRASGAGPPHILLSGRILYAKVSVLCWLEKQESPSIFRGRRTLVDRHE